MDAFTIVTDKTYLDTFKKNLITYLRCDEETFNKFSDALTKHSAIVAGGSVLDGAFLTSNTIKDIDVYVPNSNIKPFITDLHELFKFNYSNVRKNSGYCDSFLKKNKIRKIYTLESQKACLYTNAYSFDVMAVRRCRTPYDVASNFDLTVCQVVYNGKDIMATHLDHVLERRADMKPDYFTLLVQGNEFLSNRFRKYIEKGISINCPTVTRLPKKPDPISRYMTTSHYWSDEILNNWYNSVVLSVACDNIRERYYNIRGQQDYNYIIDDGFIVKKGQAIRFEKDDGYETDDCSTPENTLFFLKKRGLSVDDFVNKMNNSYQIKVITNRSDKLKNRIKKGIDELIAESNKI